MFLRLKHTDTLLYFALFVLALFSYSFFPETKSLSSGTDKIPKAIQFSPDIKYSSQFPTYITLIDKNIDNNVEKYTVTLLGQYYNNEYSEIADAPFAEFAPDDIKQQKSIIAKSQTGKIFNKHNRYVVFSNGIPLGEYLLDGLIAVNAGCYDKAGGLLKKVNESPDLPKDGFSRIGYSNIPISKPSPVSGIIETTPSKDEWKFILTYLKKLFLNKKKALDTLESHDVTCVKGKFIPNYEESYIVTFYQNNDNFIRGMCLVFSKSKNNFVENLFLSRSGNPFDLDCIGWEFADLSDIDGDGNAELLFYEEGYEWRNLGVYKYKNLKFIQVLKTNIFGC